MRGPGPAIALWAGLLLAWAIVFWAIFDHHPSYLEVLLPALAVVATLAMALVAAARSRRARVDETRALPSVSVPVPLAALGVASLVMGAEVGDYLAWFGGALLVVAAGALARELRQERALARRAAAEARALAGREGSAR